MTSTVSLRLIGYANEIEAVVTLLRIAMAGTGAHVAVDNNPFAVRRAPGMVRIYAEVVLPADIPDPEVL